MDVAVAVTLEAMLAARERRQVLQRDVLGRFGVPIVSLTIVAPGPVKATALTARLFVAAEEALSALASARRWPCLDRIVTHGATGDEAVFAYEAEAEALKRAMVALEDGHPLGRLWDLDVIAPGGDAPSGDGTGGRPLSRRGLGLGPRCCLVCGDAAHNCARSRRHPLDELQAAIRTIADGYGGFACD